MNLNIQYVLVCCIVPQLEHNQEGKSHPFVIRSTLDCLGTYSATYSDGPWNFLSVSFMLRLWYFVVNVVSAHLCFPQEHVVHTHGFAACHISKPLIVFRLQDKSTEPNPPFTHKIWWGRPKLLIIPQCQWHSCLLREVLQICSRMHLKPNCHLACCLGGDLHVHTSPPVHPVPRGNKLVIKEFNKCTPEAEGPVCSVRA